MQCHVHLHNVHFVQANVHQCQDHVQVQCVPVLLHVHNKPDQQQVHQQLVLVQDHQQLVHQIQILLIALQTLEAHQQHLVVQAVKAADVINVAELLVHLESRAVNHVRRIRVRKRCVKSSTTWRPHHLVAQLFLTVMERQQFGYVAVQPSWTLPRKSVAIQQR